MSFKNTVISIFVVFVVALILSGDGKTKGAEWNYQEDKGPKEWANLDEKYSMCAEGLNQSPINITNVVDANLSALLFEGDSKATSFINNGHSVELKFSSANTFHADGKKYYLKQIHFHTPSENQVDGKSYPMEAHLVHTSSTGQLAVVAVLFEEGSESNVINKVLRNIPENKGDKNDLKSEILGYEILPTSKEYYKYNGSLTTPPCTEGVKWFVLRTPVKLSTSQLKDFMNVMPKNNRPIQNINARTILD